MPSGIYKRTKLGGMNGKKMTGRRKIGWFLSDDTKDKLSKSHKGQKPWNKGIKMWKSKSHPMLGKKHTEETRKKMKKHHKRFSEKTKEKMRNKIPWNKGKKQWENKRHPMLGRKHSEGFYLKVKGENHHNWKGGISNDSYPQEFNSELKLKIRTRDNFICCLCGRTEREELEELDRVLCVNHINFDKNDCREENLNTLCLRCNIKINRERSYWINYFQIK